jgi:hypothetical protein
MNFGNFRKGESVRRRVYKGRRVDEYRDQVTGAAMKTLRLQIIRARSAEPHHRRPEIAVPNCTVAAEIFAQRPLPANN